MSICENCGSTYIQKRKHQKFCSSKCRLESHEKKPKSLYCPACNEKINVSIKEIREL